MTRASLRPSNMACHCVSTYDDVDERNAVVEFLLETEGAGVEEITRLVCAIGGNV